MLQGGGRASRRERELFTKQQTKNVSETRVIDRMKAFRPSTKGPDEKTP